MSNRVLFGVVVVFGFVCTLGSSCSGADSGDPEPDAGCTPGREVSCSCPDGTTGSQVCTEDRSWGDCRCDGEALDAGTDSGEADAGADAETSDDADATTVRDTIDQTDDVLDEPDEEVLYLHEDFSGLNGDPCDGIGDWFESIRVPSDHCDTALNLVDDPVRYGDEALRLHAENPDRWNYDGVNSYRVEVGTHANRWEMWNDDPPFNVVGEPIWFSFSVYIPEDWKMYNESGTETINIAEFHANGLPGDMYEDPYTAGHRKPWVMNIWDEEFTFTNGYLAEGNGSKTDRATIDRIEGGTFEPGNWYDIVVHVEWADGDDTHDGFMDIWVNGDQVYDYDGPTLLDSGEPPRPLKLSIYNSQWGGSDGYVEERTLIFDDVRFGYAEATYADMMAGRN